MRALRTLLLLAALALLPRAAVAGGSAPRDPEITVFAAASLRAPFEEIARALAAQRPPLRVRYQFAGSQVLAAQLEQGARADILATADERWMTYAERHSLVFGKPRILALNRLVVIAPRANPARLAGLADLARPRLKLVIGDAATPIGAYTRAALRRLARMPGLGPRYAERVLANAVSEEENASAIVAKVAMGEADAGIAYQSDAAGDRAGRLRVLAIPAAGNVVARYPIAVVAGSRAPAAAWLFVEYVTGKEGRRILARHGFLAPPRAAR